MEYSSADLIKILKDKLHSNITDEAALSEAVKKDDAETARKLMPAFEDLRLKFGRDMRLGHVIFLFGNGTSLYAGSKDTRKFSLDEYVNNLKLASKKESSVLSNDSFGVKKDDSALKKQELDAIKGELDSISGLGIEEQLNSLITVMSYFKIIKDSRETAVSRLIDSIKEDLIDSFVNSIDYTKLQQHKVFLLKLRYFGALNRTKIYTTNYDLAFEYTMDSLSIEYKNGFSGFVNRQFDPRTLVEGGKLELVKIHGSVNWIDEDGRIKEIQPEFKDGKVVVEDPKPVLIYPTSNKLYETYSTPYSELMRHMLDDMKEGSNAVVVLGYKYGDEHINEILYKALENPRNVFYFFIFDDPDKSDAAKKDDEPDTSNAVKDSSDSRNGGEPEKDAAADKCDEPKKSDFIREMRELGKNMPNINILRGPILASFEVFVNYILPAAAEKTDEEQVFELLKKAMLKNEQDR